MRGYSAWSAEAICKIDPQITSEFRTKSRTAKSYCSDCPVANECWQYAVMYGEHGIWGGTTDAEREIVTSSNPLLQHQLIREAQELGLLEHRYTMEQYWKSLRQARQLAAHNS